MTTNDIDAIRKLTDAATPGPWTTGADKEWSDALAAWALVIHASYPLIELKKGPQGTADAKFIAAARALVPALCDELEQTRAKLTERTAQRDSLVADLTDAGNEVDLLTAELKRTTAALTESRKGAADLANEVGAHKAELERMRAERDDFRDSALMYAAQLGDVASVKCWTNEDGKRFVFVADLQGALGVPTDAEATR